MQMDPQTLLCFVSQHPRLAWWSSRPSLLPPLRDPRPLIPAFLQMAGLAGRAWITQLGGMAFDFQICWSQ